MGFVRAGNTLLNEDYIETIDSSRLEAFIVVIKLRSGVVLELHGQPALDTIMQVNPALLEGKRMRFARRAWAFHNLIAHPLLQILSWFGYTKLGFRIHDGTQASCVRDMDQDKSERIRAKAERRKQSKQKRREALEKPREKALQEVLVKHSVTPQQEVDSLLRGRFQAVDREGFFKFYTQVVTHRSKLLSERWVKSMLALWSAIEWRVEQGLPFQSVEDWRPKIKGAMSCFLSLCQHMLEDYPQPRILWTAFDEEAANDLAPLVAYIASGGSVAKAPEKISPFPLSKKQWHRVLTDSAGLTFLEAIRYQQALPYGGSKRLAKAWTASRQGQNVNNRKNEEFWGTVLAFFAKNPMLDLAQIPTVCDYIRIQRAEIPDFSMKGRTAGALLRDVEIWHDRLQKVEEGKTTVYDPSGFESLTWEVPSKYPDVPIVWRIEEILTSKGLFDEGKALNHCVYSYSWSVARGVTSIWSMTKQEPFMPKQRCVTLEVANKRRAIVQVRGRFNRLMSPDEFRVVNRWAQEARLTIASFL